MISSAQAAAGTLLVLLLAGCGGTPAASPAPAPAPPPATAPGDHACSPRVGIDGFDDRLDGTDLNGTYVGNLSALATLPDGGVLALSDRSALFTLDPRTLRPTGVSPLRDERGEPLDSEGLVVDRDGTRLVSSEVEPSVRRYAPDGALLGTLPVPGELRVAPAGRAGRNATFEGLTLLADGRTLVASMEGALPGEGNLVRFQTWTDGAPGAQWRYPVDGGLGVSEIAGTGDGRLLVLERGYLPGIGNLVHLYLTRPPDRDQPLVKILLADLGRCPTLGATAGQPQPNPLLDNIEGLAVTGRDPDGALHLLLVSDDNQRPEQTTRLYRFTVRPPQ